MKDDDFEFDISRRLADADRAIQQAREGQMPAFAETEPADDFWELPDLDWDQDEQAAFFRDLEAMERGETVTLYEVISAEGVLLPAVELLADDELTEKLQEIVRTMEKKRAYLYSTDHLSDRELYCKLIDDIFQEETYLPTCPDSGVHFDILGSGSEEDTTLWLQYYADEDERKRWALEFPDFPIPPAKKPPFDRDRFLPQRGW